MNTKRQTVWLVSMLGLMVVLSAYYLFTDEVDQVPVAMEQTVGNQVQIEGIGMMDPTAAQQQLTLDQIAAVDGEGVAEGTAADTATQTGASAEGAAATETEQTVSNDQVLQQVSNRTGADAITAMQISRDSDFSKRIEDLTVAMTNEQASEEQITDAINKQNLLMDLEARLIAFEEKLLSNYENVAVMYNEDKKHYTVHVLAAQLEKSEAVTIISEAMKDLSVGIHQISVKIYN